jgi:hypothetical protein
MAALVLWLQRQFRQHLHSALPAQHRVSQFEQRITPPH